MLRNARSSSSALKFYYKRRRGADDKRILLRHVTPLSVYTFDSMAMNDLKYEISNERFESQDDLVDEYDDHVTSPKCLASLSFCERLLTFLVLVLVIVVIALAVAFVKAGHPPPQEERLCTTTECVTASSAILGAMDNATFPCTDFYQYACGGWAANTPLPKGKQSWDRFQEVAEHTYYTLEKLLDDDRHTLYNVAERKAKTFFRSCMHSRQVPAQAYQKLLAEMVRDAGGTDAVEPTFDVTRALLSVHKLGVYPLFSLNVDIHPQFPNINCIKVKAPTFDIDPQYLRTPNNSISKHEISEYRRHMVNMVMTLEGVAPGSVARAKVEPRVNDVIELMMLLAQATPGLADRENTLSFRKYNVTEMDITFPLMGHGWRAFMRGLFSPRRDSHTVVVFADDAVYLRRLGRILASYASPAPRRKVLRNYITWSMASTLRQYIGRHLFDDSGEEVHSEWKRCIFYTNQAFSFATGALYLNNSVQRSYVHEVQILIKYIKEAFKDYLLQKFWMDEHTRKLAAEKIDAIIDRVSYSSLLLNSTFLDHFYADLAVNASDWFANVLNWRRFHTSQLISGLNKAPSRERWLSAPVTVNTFYSPERNDLFFPAAVFQPPFFSPGWPQAMNFGALGSIIGHEITHAFDNLGRHFGKDGKLGNWWGNITADGYARAVPCMEHQYGQYNVRGYGVNGSLTVTENVADNGGLRAALLGYRLWKMKAGERKVLPGIELSDDQLFYVSFAQTYCAKYTDEGAFLVTAADNHSPHPIRVRGTIMNSESFSAVYKCGLNSKMNSRIKCIVW